MLHPYPHQGYGGHGVLAGLVRTPPCARRRGFVRDLGDQVWYGNGHAKTKYKFVGRIILFLVLGFWDKNTGIFIQYSGPSHHPSRLPSTQ